MMYSPSPTTDETTIWAVQKGGCEYFRGADFFDGKRNPVSFRGSVVAEGSDIP